MVTLNRITTRTGDDGTTGLSDGSRLPKDHPLIQAIGSVDEANSVFGLLTLEQAPPAINSAIPLIQNDLFDLGADLATPPGGPYETKIPRIQPAQVAHLESWAAAANADLPPLKSFILPGGSRAATWLHLARTVVRRAERDVIHAEHADAARAWNPHVRHYLNRLSDLCFVWSRVANAGQDVLWQPGGTPR
jgi:cob(I)alamin adenosyltransferase